MEIRGKTAIVTGGTDGIGAATALELKRRGARVWVIGRSQEKGERVVSEAARSGGTGSLQFIQADLSLMSTVSVVVEQLQHAITRVDILVHCVGILIAHKEHTPEGIEKDL